MQAPATTVLFKECSFCEQGKVETRREARHGNWTECAECGRVGEERQPKLKHTSFSAYRWEPYAVSPPGSAAASASPRPPAPPPAIDEGFITCYSAMSGSVYSTDFAFSRSLSGEVIEMQRLVGQDIVKWAKDSKELQSDSACVAAIGFITIGDLCARLGRPLVMARAVRLFQRCVSSTGHEKSTSFEALAVAAFAVYIDPEFAQIAAKAGDGTGGGQQDETEQGSGGGGSQSGATGGLEGGILDDASTRRDADAERLATAPPGGGPLSVGGKRAPRLATGLEAQTELFLSTDMSTALGREPAAIGLAKILQIAMQTAAYKDKLTDQEIRKHIIMIRNVLNNEPIVVEALRESMSKYFEDLGLEKRTASLAAHIGNQAVKRNLCQRRNSSSLSAAAVYLACTLEGQRTTQSQFCRTVQLTEVTLRKVYKELKEHWRDLVPDDYKPFKTPNGARGSGGGSRSRARNSPARRTASRGAAKQRSSSAAVALGGSTQRPIDLGFDTNVPEFQGFAIPKQLALNGDNVWECKEASGGAAKAPANPVLMAEYPRPGRVLATVDASEGIGQLFDDEATPTHVPGFSLGRGLPGMARRQVRPGGP